MTTTFITDNSFHYIKETNRKNVLIFTHHPFYQKTTDFSWHDAIYDNVDLIRERNIAIYVGHMALDFHQTYSTAYYLAREFIKNPKERLKYPYSGIVTDYFNTFACPSIYFSDNFYE